MNSWFFKIDKLARRQAKHKPNKMKLTVGMNEDKKNKNNKMKIHKKLTVVMFDTVDQLMNVAGRSWRYVELNLGDIKELKNLLLWFNLQIWRVLKVHSN